MIDYAPPKRCRTRRTLLLVASGLAFAVSSCVTFDEYGYMKAPKSGAAPFREVVRLDERNGWAHQFVIDRPGDGTYSLFLFRGTGVADVRQWLAQSAASVNVVATQNDRFFDPYVGFVEDRNRAKRELAYEFCQISPHKLDAPLTIRVTAQLQWAPVEVALSRGSKMDRDWGYAMKSWEMYAAQRPIFLAAGVLSFLAGFIFLYLGCARAKYGRTARRAPG